MLPGGALSMGAPTSVVALVVGVSTVDFAGDGSYRRQPVVALFFNLPRLGLATFQACVRSGIRRTAEADLVPRPGMSVVGIDCIGHDYLPEALDRHLLPYLGSGLGRALFDRLENFVPMTGREYEELAAVAVFGFAVDGIDADLIHHTILRHVFEAIAHRPVCREAVIEHGHEGNLAVGRAVGLRHKMGKYGRPESPGFRREELARGRLLDPRLDHLTGCVVPEGALRKRAETGIVAGLLLRRQSLQRGGIARKKRGFDGGKIGLHFWLRRKRLARMPNMPAAPKSSGAKMGGPYMML